MIVIVLGALFSSLELSLIVNSYFRLLQTLSCLHLLQVRRWRPLKPRLLHHLFLICFHDVLKRNRLRLIIIHDMYLLYALAMNLLLFLLTRRLRLVS
jgi:hypothetical protein